MSGIGHVNGTDNIHRLSGAGSASAPSATPATAGVTGGDQVEISQRGQLMSQLKGLPEIRIDKVNEVKSAIERGDYETDERLDGTIDVLLRDPDALGTLDP